MSEQEGPRIDPETGRLVLDPETRNDLHDELFARWNALEPGGGHCFCGDDQDLVDAVERARAQMTERERDRDRDPG